MKTYPLIAVLSFSLHLVGQTPGSATSVGTCNVSNTGSSANLVLECGIGKAQGKDILHATENVFVSALLHDVVEDCGVSVEQVRERWGDRIAQAIDALSRRKGESYSAYIERLREDRVAVRVKLADLEDNLMGSRIGTLPPEEQKRLRRRYEQALTYLRSKGD